MCAWENWWTNNINEEQYQTEITTYTEACVFYNAETGCHIKKLIKLERTFMNYDACQIHIKEMYKATEELFL